MKAKEISDVGMVFYVLACVFSLGLVWILKLAFQKALSDTFAEE